jgi:glutamate carboxypeptidase
VTAAVEGFASARQAMIEQLRRLVEVESPSAEVEATSRCADVVAALGAELTGRRPDRIEVDGRPHLLWPAVGSSGRQVVLIGHFDTVWPLGTIDRWPFTVAGGRATGPGAFDMKAGIVQMLHALASLPDSGSVACLLTSDEEIGSQTSRALIEETAAGARAALILEPSLDGALKVARKGTSMYTVHITGRAAHAGLEPERGINATIEMAHQVLSIAHLGLPEIGTTVTPTVARAGTTLNTVPADAHLDVDVRASTRDEQARVDTAIRALRGKVPGTVIAIDGGPNRPPFDRSASAALYDRAQKIAAGLGIVPPPEIEVGGGSDGNFTAGLGVPTLDGLGAVGAGAHAEGEYVEVDGMPERAALLAALITDLLSG